MRTALLLISLLVAAGCGSSSGSIGAMLGKGHADGRVVVRDVPQGMEASKAGLQTGDEVLTIDGRDVRRMTAAEIHEALIGPTGTYVDLAVLRGDEVIRLRVRRGPLR